VAVFIAVLSLASATPRQARRDPASGRTRVIYTRTHYAEAVQVVIQVVSLICDGEERALLLNLIE